MNVDAIKNSNPVFKMNEINAGQIIPEQVPQAVSQVVPQVVPQVQVPSQQMPYPGAMHEGQPVMQQPLNQDVFNGPLQMPNFKKMKTGQQIMGGSLLGAAALGVLSACSSKTWLRMLFVVPVAGVMALFGANMLQNAKAVDKIAALYNNPQGQ